MLFDILNVKNYIPKEHIEKIQDINFEEMYKLGKRVVLTDLDNTLISYAFDKPTEEIKEFVQQLKNIGYTVVVVSNSPSSRVQGFVEELDVVGVALARKPLKKYMLKGIDHLSNSKEEMLFFGDQLMTDVLVGNRLGIDTYLVDAIERKTEKWYTRINRRIERVVLRRIKRKHNDDYSKKLKRVGERYGL